MRFYTTLILIANMVLTTISPTTYLSVGCFFLF
eukprot:UN21121